MTSASLSSSVIILYDYILSYLMMETLDAITTDQVFLQRPKLPSASTTIQHERHRNDSQYRPIMSTKLILICQGNSSKKLGLIICTVQHEREREKDTGDSLAQLSNSI